MCMYSCSICSKTGNRDAIRLTHDYVRVSSYLHMITLAQINLHLCEFIEQQCLNADDDGKLILILITTILALIIRTIRYNIIAICLCINDR